MQENHEKEQRGQYSILVVVVVGVFFFFSKKAEKKNTIICTICRCYCTNGNGQSLVVMMVGS